MTDFIGILQSFMKIYSWHYQLEAEGTDMKQVNNKSDWNIRKWHYLSFSPAAMNNVTLFKIYLLFNLGV